MWLGSFKSHRINYSEIASGGHDMKSMPGHDMSSMKKGDSADGLKECAGMMRKIPGMKHAESTMTMLNPSPKGGRVWQFPQTGTVDFACLTPGHLEAGMVGKSRLDKT